MKIIKSAILLILTVAAAISCGQVTGKKVKESQKMTVRVLTVRNTENPGVRSFVGTASALKSAYLSCRYPGKLVRVAVSQGDIVKKGDTVAVIESQTVLTSREMAYATLRQAEDGYERVSKVHKSGSVADVKLIEIETKLAQARAAAKSADNALADCTVKAPFDGVVGEVFTDEGIEISSVDNIARIMDISEVEIHFPVPESEVGTMSVGAMVTVDIPALDLSGIKGKVTSKGIVASPLSHTYDCTLKLLEKIPDLMPGMVCKVYFVKEGGKGYVIPAQVVRTDVSGRYVWGVRDGKVIKIPVSVDGFSGSGVIVTEGLMDGDKVIVEGGQKVCSGIEVLTVE